MAEDDPYVAPPDPYQSAYAGPAPVMMPPPQVRNRDAMTAFSQEHKANIAAREQQIGDVTSKQQLNVDQMTKMLDDTINAIKSAKTAKDRVNLPLIQLGAGLMGPGSFGTQMSRGLSGMAGAIQKDRDEEQEDAFKIADLGMRRATIANAPLQEKLAYLRALQQGDISGLNALQRAEITTAPALIKANQPKVSGNFVIQPDGSMTNLVTGQRIDPTQFQDPSKLGITPTLGPNEQKNAPQGVGPGQPGQYNEKALEGLTPEMANVIKMMVAGEYQLPGGRGQLKPENMFALQKAKEYDPTFDTTDYNARAQAKKSWTTGKQADQVRSGATLYGHLFEAYVQAAGMNNSQLPAVNEARNAFLAATGSSQTSDFEVTKGAIINELGKFLRGGQTTDAESREWSQKINASQSPEQLQKAIEGMMGVMQQQFAELAHQKSQGYGRQFEWTDMLSPEKREMMQFMRKNPLNTAQGRTAAINMARSERAKLTGEEMIPVPTTPVGKPTPPTQTGQRGTSDFEGKRIKLPDGRVQKMVNGNWVDQ